MNEVAPLVDGPTCPIFRDCSGAVIRPGDYLLAVDHSRRHRNREDINYSAVPGLGVYRAELMEIHVPNEGTVIEMYLASISRHQSQQFPEPRQMRLIDLADEARLRLARNWDEVWDLLPTSHQFTD